MALRVHPVLVPGELAAHPDIGGIPAAQPQRVRVALGDLNLHRYFLAVCPVRRRRHQHAVEVATGQQVLIQLANQVSVIGHARLKRHHARQKLGVKNGLGEIHLPQTVARAGVVLDMDVGDIAFRINPQLTL